MSEQNRLQINWVNSAGAALGAVSSAVVLSTFGVAGTLIGAAVGSLCISVGGAFYAHSMKLAKQRMERAARIATRARVRADRAQATGSGVAGSARSGSSATAQLEPGEELDAAGTGQSVWSRLRGLQWKRIVAVTVALFVVAMALIVAVELRIGRPISDLTGGSDSGHRTSIPRIGGSGDDSGQDEQERDQQDPGDESEPETPQEPAPTPDPEEEVPEEEAPATPEPAEPTPSEPAPVEPAPADPTPAP